MVDTVNLPDTPALPGEAASWRPGESVSGMPGADDARKEVTGKLADVQKEKIAASDKIYGEIEGAQSRLLPRIEQLSKDAGVEAQNLKPWNADEEAAKRRTDPIAAFGSFGSVFGILASAFTHAPMENALNASAAAMNAIKAGDDKAYERAHTAWTDNTKLALDRHKIQHDAYQDAVSLLNVNMSAANTKLQVLAARFGDKQVQTLLEAGMSKEVEEVLAARQRNALALEQTMPKVVEENAKLSRLFALGYNPKEPQTEKSQKALVQFQNEQAELKRRGSAFGGGAANLTTERQRAQDVAAYRQQLRSEENEDGTPKYNAEDIARKAAEYEKSLKVTAAAPSGNKLDELGSKINRVEYAESTIDKVEGLLKKHKALTGLGGKILRPAEAVGNIFGSDATDRKQFERYISELQEWAPRILTDSNGRPLSAEAGKVSNIIAGLNMGDTTANTARAYAELKPLLKRIKEDLAKRRGGSPASSEAPAAPEKRPSWMDAPVVGGDKRSDAENDSIPKNARPAQYKIGGKEFARDYDEPVTPQDRINQGHSWEFVSPTRPSTFNPEYHSSLSHLQGMTGERSVSDIRALDKNYKTYQAMNPDEKLKWYMNLVGPSPIEGARQGREVSAEDRQKLKKWQTDNIDKVIRAFISGQGLPE